MSLRRVGIVVAVVAVIAAAYSLVASREHGVDRDEALTAGEFGQAANTDSESRERPSIQDSLEAGRVIVKSDVEPDGGDDARNVPEENSNALQIDPANRPEEYYVQDGSLVFEHISELQHDQQFTNLLAELSLQNDSIAAEKRRNYELLFYSQEQTRDGSVMIDAFECGSQICAAALRSNDPAAVEQFIRSATSSSEFEGNAIARLSSSGDNGEFERFVFAHDSTIEGFTLPPEGLVKQSDSDDR